MRVFQVGSSRSKAFDLFGDICSIVTRVQPTVGVDLFNSSLPEKWPLRAHFFLNWGREGRKALPHAATLGSAGGCGQDGGRGDGGDGGDGCGGGGPWKSTVECAGFPRFCLTL